MLQYIYCDNSILSRCLNALGERLIRSNFKKALKTQKVAFLDFNLTGCAITCRPCKLDMNLIIYKLKNGSASKQLSKPCLDLIMFISIKHVIFIFQLFVLVYVMLLKIQRGR